MARARTLAEDLALAEQAMAMESEAAVLRAERAALLAASVRAGKLKHRQEKKEEAKYALIVQQEKDALAARKEQVMKEAQERRAATVPRPATAKKKKKQTPKKRPDPAVSELIDGFADSASHTDVRSMPSHHHSGGHHPSPERASAAVSEAPVSPVSVARAESVSPSHSTGVPSDANTHARTLAQSSSLPAVELVNPAHTAPSASVAPVSDSHSTSDASAAADASMLVREEDDYADDTTAEEDDASFAPLSYPLRPQSSKRSRPASGHSTVAPLPHQSPQPVTASAVAPRPPQPPTRALQLSWDVPRLLVREPTPPIEPQPRLSEMQVHAHWPADNDKADNNDGAPLAPSAEAIIAAAAPAIDASLAGAVTAPDSAALVDPTAAPATVTELATPQPAIVPPRPVSPPARDHIPDMQSQPQPLSPTAAAATSAPSHASPVRSASAVASVSPVAASEAQVSQLSAAIETLSRVIAQHRPGSAGGHASTASSHRWTSLGARTIGSSRGHRDSDSTVDRSCWRGCDGRVGIPLCSASVAATPSTRAAAASLSIDSANLAHPRPASRPVSHPASPRALAQAAPATQGTLVHSLTPVLRSAAVPPASVAHDDFSGPAEDVVTSPRSARHSISNRSRPTSAVSRPQSATQSRRKSNSKSKNKSKSKRGSQKQKHETPYRSADEQHRPTNESKGILPDVAAAVSAISRPRTPVAADPPVATSDAPAAELPSAAVDLAPDGSAHTEMPSAAASADLAADVAVPKFVAARTAPPPASHFSPTRAPSAMAAGTFSARRSRSTGFRFPCACLSAPPFRGRQDIAQACCAATITQGWRGASDTGIRCTEFVGRPSYLSFAVCLHIQARPPRVEAGARNRCWSGRRYARCLPCGSNACVRARYTIAPVIEPGCGFRSRRCS